MELITLDAPDGPAEAYVSRPEGGSGPGVLLCIDAIGLRPRIAEMAARIAGWGYVVLAPNTLYRSGTAAETSPDGDLREPGARDAFFAHAMPRLAELTATRAEDDLRVWTQELASLEGVTGDSFGAVGYCMGAAIAMRAAIADPRYAAVGGFHGARLATDDPTSPHLGLRAARAAFCFGHADEDPSMPPESISRLGRALAEAGLTGVNEVYPGAQHGFTMADTSVYDEEATERSFADLEALFARTLRG